MRLFLTFQGRSPTRPFGRFVLLILAVMTETYARFRHDDVFLQEHFSHPLYFRARSFWFAPIGWREGYAAEELSGSLSLLGSGVLRILPGFRKI